MRKVYKLITTLTLCLVGFSFVSADINPTLFKSLMEKYFPDKWPQIGFIKKEGNESPLPMIQVPVSNSFSIDIPDWDKLIEIGENSKEDETTIEEAKKISKNLLRVLKIDKKDSLLSDMLDEYAYPLYRIGSFLAKPSKQSSLLKLKLAENTQYFKRKENESDEAYWYRMLYLYLAYDSKIDKKNLDRLYSDFAEHAATKIIVKGHNKLNWKQQEYFNKKLSTAVKQNKSVVQVLNSYRGKLDYEISDVGNMARIQLQRYSSHGNKLFSKSGYRNPDTTYILLGKVVNNHKQSIKKNTKTYQLVYKISEYYSYEKIFRDIVRNIAVEKAKRDGFSYSQVLFNVYVASLFGNDAMNSVFDATLSQIMMLPTISTLQGLAMTLFYGFMSMQDLGMYREVEDKDALNDWNRMLKNNVNIIADIINNFCKKFSYEKIESAPHYTRSISALGATALVAFDKTIFTDLCKEKLQLQERIYKLVNCVSKSPLISLELAEIATHRLQIDAKLHLNSFFDNKLVNSNWNGEKLPAERRIERMFRVTNLINAMHNNKLITDEEKTNFNTLVKEKLTL